MATAKNTKVQEDAAMATAAKTQQDDAVMKIEDELAPCCSMHLPCYHKKLVLILTDASNASGNLSDEDANTDTKMQCQEFISEFLSVYTCGAYGSSSSDAATAQVNKPKNAASVEAPAAITAAAATSTTTLAKNDCGGAMEEFISKFVSFYSFNVGLPTLPSPQPSVESNEAPTTTSTATDEQLEAKDDEEEGALKEFLREFIAFYSMGTIGTTDSATNNGTPSIEKAKAYYPASSRTENNPGKSTSEEDMGVMKEFLREFVAFYTFQRDNTVPTTKEKLSLKSKMKMRLLKKLRKQEGLKKDEKGERGAVDQQGFKKIAASATTGKTPTFAPAVSSEQEDVVDNKNVHPLVAESTVDDASGGGSASESPKVAPAHIRRNLGLVVSSEAEEEDAADDKDVHPVVTESRNDTPTVDDDPTASSSSSSSSSSTKQKKKSSRSSTPANAMMKLFSSASSSSSSSSSSSTKQKKKSSRSSTPTKAMMKLYSSKKIGSSSSAQAVE